MRMCDAVCPWNRLIDFSMRKIVRQATFGLTEIESEDIWRCTTCGSCPQRVPGMGYRSNPGCPCAGWPRNTNFPQRRETAAQRSASLISEPAIPCRRRPAKACRLGRGAVGETVCRGDGDLIFRRLLPQLRPALEKGRQGHSRYPQPGGVDFGILGTKENCCGESIRKTGNEDLFKRLARENIKTFIENGVKKILVSSPHCYHTFKNEYPEFMVNFEVVHISQYFELIDAGRLELTKACKCSSPIMTHVTWAATMGFMTPPGKF
jgi:hypothetical protein